MMIRSLTAALIFVSLSAHAAAPRFFAAAGKVDISPDLETQTIWLAGFGAKGRRAEGIHDPLFARALVVSDGSKTVALVVVDSIGIFRQDVLDVRRGLGWEGKDRYLLLAATHVHSAPDTLGLWGRFPGVNGVDPDYHQAWKSAVVALVKDLSGQLQESVLSAGKRTLDPRGLCRDMRDPVVIDPELNVLSVTSTSGKPIATLVRWSCHPEVIGPDNHEITADYPGPLCSRIEEKKGGTCLFFAGSVGGMMTPDVEEGGGSEQAFAESVRVGERLADESLAALAKPDRWSRGKVSFDTRVIRVPIENSRYLLFLQSLIFGHDLTDARNNPIGRFAAARLSLRHLIFYPLPARLRPWVETEVSLIQLGPVKFLGIPGEIFPELVIGGYQGEYRFGYPLTRPTNTNPPDLESAPKPPYLRQLLNAEHGFVLGLANDQMGYIMPRYDFEVTPTRSMTPKPAGTHYEETNSVGKSAASIILDAAQELLKP